MFSVDFLRPQEFSYVEAHGDLVMVSYVLCEESTAFEQVTSVSPVNTEYSEALTNKFCFRILDSGRIGWLTQLGV